MLILAPVRFAGDSEVCEVPYQNTAIDGAVEIKGKITGFRAAVRPDGNIVVVVEVADVSGCEAKASTPTADISGRWDFTRTKDFKDQRTIDLVRDSSCDQSGYTCYTYQAPLIKRDKEIRKFFVFIKGSEVLTCMINCDVFSCAGELTDYGTDQKQGEVRFQRNTWRGVHDVATQVKTPPLVVFAYSQELSCALLEMIHL